MLKTFHLLDIYILTRVVVLNSNAGRPKSFICAIICKNAEYFDGKRTPSIAYLKFGQFNSNLTNHLVSD